MRREAEGNPSNQNTSSLKPHSSCLFSDAGGIRTRNREGLSFAAVPVRVPRREKFEVKSLKCENFKLRTSQFTLPSGSPRNRTLSNSFEDCRANPSHSQARREAKG